MSANPERALSAGDASIDNVTFTDNTGGAAVEVGELGSGGATVSVTGSRFSDNGGGIRVNSSTSTISDTEFVGNQGAAVTIDHGSSTITNVLARENTRGITGIDGTITVTGSHVRDNFGYGIRNTGNSSTGMPLTVTDTIVERNRVAGVECSYCTNLTITGSTITDTVPDGFGGSGVSFLQNLPGPTRHDHRLGDQRQRRHRTRRWGSAAGDRRPGRLGQHQRYHDHRQSHRVCSAMAPGSTPRRPT